MLKKTILKPGRVRRINGGFSFIPHRFLSEGFLAALSQQELVLYFFLVLVSDRNGVSYYRYDAICGLLKMTLGDYIEARDGLIEKDLLAFDGTVFQVLSLPVKVSEKAVPKEDAARVMQLITESLEEVSHDR